jgi:hypothetical protein
MRAVAEVNLWLGKKIPAAVPHSYVDWAVLALEAKTV